MNLIQPQILLASASPRRRQLIALLGLPVEVAPQGIDEVSHLLDSPVRAVLNIALAKARSATLAAAEGTYIVAADTVVVLDGSILGKPETPEQASQMLGRLAGRSHEVLTATVIRQRPGRQWSAVTSTRVEMRAYTDEEIVTYVDRGEPFDKAGGYAVQDKHFRPVGRLDGCFLNVVGLPLCAVGRGFQSFGVDVPAPPDASTTASCDYCRQGASLVEIG